MGYSFFHNSRYRSRGTAILLSKRVVCTIVGRFTDDECNMLLLKLAIGNVTITVGSIYGPNDDDENFFRKLEDGIEALQSDYVVMGGDWNTTYDNRNNRFNIDTHNMVGIPSTRRSLWLNRLCTRKALKDPFRYLYPDIKEFKRVYVCTLCVGRQQ
jgi:hypothetical protein